MPKKRVLPKIVQIRHIKSYLRKINADLDSIDLNKIVDAEKSLAENKKVVLDKFPPIKASEKPKEMQPTSNATSFLPSKSLWYKEDREGMSQSNNIQPINLKPEADKNMAKINPVKPKDENECGACSGKFEGRPKYCPNCGVELEADNE